MIIGTEIVLTGDPDQIGNPYVDAGNNGLTYTVERFRDVDIAGQEPPGRARSERRCFPAASPKNLFGG